MSLAGRLYRGETNFDFIGTKKKWYLASVVLVLVCVASFLVRGFNFGIEFEGGNSFQFPANDVSLSQARETADRAGVEAVSAQFVGSGGSRSVLIKTPELNADQENDVKQEIAGLGVPAEDISINSVSSSWGSDITRQALIGLVVFLIAVCVFIAIRFEYRMAIAAIVALFHDLLVSAGIYSLVGFEVTPSTVVGLLTILGFSLYDTVVVFDKVEENTRGILGGARTTYSEQANLAVNQTLMRSINTSLIALLPVAGLLFVGAGILGVGTIKDLALVLFVGLASGAYSSLFLATPVLCDLKERDPKYAALNKRVMNKRATAARSATTEPKATKARAKNAEVQDEVDEVAAEDEEEPVEAAVASSTPRPGARPKQQPRRRPAQRKGGGRPSAKRRR